MLVNKGWRLWISLVVILAIMVLVLSCSQLSRSLTPAPPPTAETLTPNQLTPSGTQASSPSANLTPNLNPSPPSNTQELTPNQPTPSETQTSPTPTDLSLFINSNPVSVDNSKFPITPVEQLHVTGSAPEIDIEKYRLIVDGLVDTPLSLTYDAIMRYPTVTEVVLLICPGVFADNAQWTGVPVSTILAEAGVKPQASKVTFYAADQYQVTFSLDEVQRDGVFLAHTVDGQILPKDHGHPLRLVVKGYYGNNWVKWVDHIEIK